MQRDLFDHSLAEPLAAPLAPPRAEAKTGVARARKADPASSHDAAERMNATGAAADHRDLIRAVVCKGGGWTSYEIAKATGLTNVQVSRRLSGMADIKKADDSLARVCRVRRIKLATYWDRRMFEGGDDA